MSFGGSRGKSSSTFTNLPFGLSYSDVSANGSTELPLIPLPMNHPSNELEKEIAIHYMNFKTALKDGPFFTGSMELISEQDDQDDTDAQGTGSKKKGPRLQVDADGLNDGIERYSDKYLKRRKIGTSIDEHPFNVDFFPRELYQVMGINKKKLIQLSKLDKGKTLFGLSGSKEEDEAVGRALLEKMSGMVEEDDEEDGNEEKEVEKEDIDEDDEFEEDDDDDYNAEKYFDDGDDDLGGDDEYPDEAEF
ncbi:unnamed protein product [Kluyveromyces dobzhanskii CBS 2104]|uniref:DNA-directed RNA polymerase III subunit n=1 Tax=Kluyveromyces dobzhanskii CBS 2104 TaxID=1427455 RepID=A0A0A8KZ50_9SACH|nr:unnamed protein product [Kluyveromyces dobzhanskii CBS 2104]